MGALESFVRDPERATSVALPEDVVVRWVSSRLLGDRSATVFMLVVVKRPVATRLLRQRRKWLPLRLITLHTYLQNSICARTPYRHTIQASC